MNINKLSVQILMGNICKVKNLFVQSMLLIYRIMRQMLVIGYLESILNPFILVVSLRAALKNFMISFD